MKKEKDDDDPFIYSFPDFHVFCKNEVFPMLYLIYLIQISFLFISVL